MVLLCARAHATQRFHFVSVVCRLFSHVKMKCKQLDWKSYLLLIYCWRIYVLFTTTRNPRQKKKQKWNSHSHRDKHEQQRRQKKMKWKQKYVYACPPQKGWAKLRFIFYDCFCWFGVSFFCPELVLCLSLRSYNPKFWNKNPGKKMK